MADEPFQNLLVQAKNAGVAGVVFAQPGVGNFCLTYLGPEAAALPEVEDSLWELYDRWVTIEEFRMLSKKYNRNSRTSFHSRCGQACYIVVGQRYGALKPYPSYHLDPIRDKHKRRFQIGAVVGKIPPAGRHGGYCDPSAPVLLKNILADLGVPDPYADSAAWRKSRGYPPLSV